MDGWEGVVRTKQESTGQCPECLASHEDGEQNPDGVLEVMNNFVSTWFPKCIHMVCAVKILETL